MWLVTTASLSRRRRPGMRNGDAPITGTGSDRGRRSRPRARASVPSAAHRVQSGTRLAVRLHAWVAIVPTATLATATGHVRRPSPFGCLESSAFAALPKNASSFSAGENLGIRPHEVTRQTVRRALARPRPHQRQERPEREPATTALDSLVRFPQHPAPVRREVFTELVVEREIQLCAPELPIAILPVLRGRCVERHDAPFVLLVRDAWAIPERRANHTNGRSHRDRAARSALPSGAGGAARTRHPS